MKRQLNLTALLFFLLSSCFAKAENTPEKRLAIVIGNGKYVYAGELENPVNDARSMRDALQGLGFDVYEYENLTQSQLKMAIDDFGTRLKNYSTGLFFYAGHGIQAKGANYLIPVDANIQSEQQIEYDCVQADRVLGFMEAAGSRINIVILDACRNNPFERSWSRAVNGSGLAFMNAPTGSLIAYSTSPGRTASDGSGSNGLYTEALLQNMKTPDITILQMFQNVRKAVSEKSAKQQIPWESTSLTDDFFFITPDIKPEKKDVQAYWLHAEDGFYFYVNNENVAKRSKNTWSDTDLLVYDPVTGITGLLENYDASPLNKNLPVKIIGSGSDIFWRSKDGYYYIYVKGEQIADATAKSSYVNNDLLVYLPATNTTYLLENYTKMSDNKLHPASVLDNADFAFWSKTPEDSYYLYVKGEMIQDRVISAFAGDDLVAWDKQSNISYLLKGYATDKEHDKLRTASVLSYQDNAFWSKRNGAYWLLVKGDAIHDHTTSRWEGSDLYVTDTKTNITYILLNYESAPEDQVHVAMVAP
jgi:hypothetical protein